MELDDEGLSVSDLEESVEMMFHNLLGEIHDGEVHLLARLKAAGSRLNLEDLLSKDLLLERELLRGDTGIYPRLEFNLRVVGHFEAPVGSHSTDILESDSNSAGVLSSLVRDLAEVPGELG